MKSLRSAKTTVTNGLFKFLPDIEEQAATYSKKTVKDWAQTPVTWATHRATNRNHGEWKSYKGVTYEWNEDL